MDITWCINIFILVPLAGFLISLFLPKQKELLISRVAFFTAGINLAFFLVFIVLWLVKGHPTLNIKEIVLFRTSEYEFLVDFYFDKITAVYLLVGSFLTFLITLYSRYYLHRESGYKRFFNTILFFFVGFNLTIFAGNFETLFIGWEILGISSFLLIAFYRDRYLPVKNAVKVFSIYRIGDVGILLAMWASHHLWQENITFLKLNNYQMVHDQIQSHSAIGIFISLMILAAAAAKSAQLPFSSWLPRAMEGPTPSSAIFYGSLSVHFGVFLLLRTYTFWEYQTSVRILIAVLGLSTSVVATFIARVQSSIKTQIAYASIAQIGLIFIEIALGFEKLALFHFAGNAFLRTYQLLVSPSSVSYLIREQFYNFVPRKHSFEDSLPKKIEYSFYVLALKEWNLDRLMNTFVFRPMKKVGKKLDFLTVKNIFFYVVPVYIIGIVFLLKAEIIPHDVRKWIPSVLSGIGLLMVLKAFSERENPILAWLLVILNHFWIALAVSYNEEFDFDEVALYLSGVVVFGAIGYYALHRLKLAERNNFGLMQYYGHVQEYPGLALTFLISGLGVMGFPISTTFIGEDTIFSHIHENEYVLAFFNCSGFIIGGIAVIRMYARIFLGPHVKTYHETPYRSS